MEGALVKKYHYSSSYGFRSVPLPLTVFPTHFFFRMLFARSTQDKRHWSGRILQYVLLAAKKLARFPQVACKEKADQCKFLTIQKFVKGRRVPIFPSMTPITGVSANEITFSIQFVQASR